MCPEWQQLRHLGIKVFGLTPRLQHAAFSAVSHPHSTAPAHRHPAFRITFNLIHCKKGEQKKKQSKEERPRKMKFNFI